MVTRLRRRLLGCAHDRQEGHNKLKGNGGTIFLKMKFNLQNCNNDGDFLKNIVVFIGCSQIRRLFHWNIVVLWGAQIRPRVWPKTSSLMLWYLQKCHRYRFNDIHQSTNVVLISWKRRSPAVIVSIIIEPSQPIYLFINFEAHNHRLLCHFVNLVTCTIAYMPILLLLFLLIVFFP